MLTQLNVLTYDVKKIAQSIFDIDPLLASIVFGKDSQTATESIKKLILLGSNSFGKVNIYLYKSGEEVIGFFIGYKYEDKIKWSGRKIFRQVMSLVNYIKLRFFGSQILNKILVTEFNKDDFYLADILIFPEIRNKGFGKILLQEVITFAKLKKCKRILLEVNSNNTKALNFYLKNGFQLLNRKSIQFKGEIISIYHLYLNLND